MTFHLALLFIFGEKSMLAVGAAPSIMGTTFGEELPDKERTFTKGSTTEAICELERTIREEAL